MPRNARVHAAVRSHRRYDLPQGEWKNGYSTMSEMQTIPSGRVCDYDDKGECAETIGVHKVARPYNEPY
jgi:hypothetical protein